MALFGRQLAVSGPQAPQNIGAGGAAAPSGGEINLDNILKLIPGEVVPLYITGIGLNVTSVYGVGWPPHVFWFGWRPIVFWLCFATCGILRGVASKPVGAVGWFTGVNWRLVLVSLLAFFLWAHAVSTPAPVVDLLPTAAWGFFAMILGVFAPLLVPTV